MTINGHMALPAALDGDRPTLFITAEAAHYLGLATTTLNKWRIYGHGPRFVKLGRAVRYRKDDLDRYLADRTKRSTSEA